MTVSFDTLSFAKRLTEAGEKPAVAEAHAMALKEFVMDVIATKADLRELGRSLSEEIADVRDDVANVRGAIADVRGEVAEVRTEMRAEFAKVRSELRGEIAEVRSGLHTEINDVRQDLASFRKEVGERFATKDELRHEIGLLRKDIDAMGLKLTVRMGGMIAIALGAMATLSKMI